MTLRQRGGRQTANSLRRGRPDILRSGKSFLIVTEGARTEPLYLKALKERLRLSAATVEVVHPEGTDPMTLLKAALERRKERKRQAKRDQISVPYDEIWIVFDLERVGGIRREQAAQARDSASRHGIRICSTDPCFEFWLLLHERYTTRPFAECNEVLDVLRVMWPTYAKGSQLDAVILEKVPTAVSNAAYCRAHHMETGGDGNPSTDLDLLIRALNEAAVKGNRFEFS